ncbi:MAG: hypothetical protein M1829_004142 [Trizodia sp. TS-e1964]|nr:MAG: hypothetical protein M1829_004142 [Trizodia sp. TS-e1964]
MAPLRVSPRASFLLAMALALNFFGTALGAARRGAHAALDRHGAVAGEERVRCDGRISLGTSLFSTKYCLTYTGGRGNTAAKDAETECGVFTIVELVDKLVVISRTGPSGHDRYCKLGPSSYLDCSEVRVVDSGLRYDTRTHVLSAEGHTGVQVLNYSDRDWVFFDPEGTHDFPFRVYCDRGSVVPQIVEKGGAARVQ